MTDSAERLNRAEMKIGLIEAQLQKELGGPGNTGSVYAAITETNEKVERLMKVLLGNGELGIKGQLSLLDSKVDDIARNNARIQSELSTRVKEIGDRLSGRPSWSVLVIISFLTSTLTGFIIANLAK